MKRQDYISWDEYFMGDDVKGRSRIYELIVKGQNVLTAGRPESFNVLLKEMQSLGLDIRTVRGGDDR